MMTDSDNILRERVVQAWQEDCSDRAPSFNDTWQAAVAQHAGGRRRYRRLAGVAVVAAAIAMAIAMNLPAPPGEAYITATDLLETTYWSAPSDVLLPDSQFDIYQEIPELFESTKPVEGALL